MTIPYEVSYQRMGDIKTRNVIGVMCPTVFNQEVSQFKQPPIFVELGDVNVDWEATSPGLKNAFQKGLL